MVIDFLTKSSRARRLSLAAWDVFGWALAVVVLLGARYDFHLTRALWPQVCLYLVTVAALQLLVGWFTKLYQGRHTVGSFDEVSNLAAVAMIGGAVAGLTYVLLPPRFPNGIALAAPFLALLFMGAGRFVFRAALQARIPARADAEPVLIYGAGNAGQQIARLIASEENSEYVVAGFIDDDITKRHLHVARSRVLGTSEKLLTVADQLGVKTILLAISEADGEFKRRVGDLVEGAGLELLVLPPLKQIVGGRVALDQLHKLEVADLLGRKPIHTDLSEISSYLTGRRVLVTGAGGSIGSELARQVHTFGPSELIMLDRDESGLHAVQLSIYGQGLLDTPDMVLCDIRDLEALDEVFAYHQPEVVFHAAALKHLPMLEQYPAEGWKTNVQGTWNVLECAQRHGVQRFVNVSTDKAADPSSVLGKTKRKAEEITAWYAEQHAGAFLSVRFGNVLGSRGSMLHTFTKQIDAGGPITVTHPEVTRYFMTIPESCELVIQAGAIGDPADVLVLDMGEPVRILDVATRLITQSGKPIEIVYTGLRPGEKLHEVLFSGVEHATSTQHSMISRVNVPAFDPRGLADHLRQGSSLPYAELP